MQSYKKSTSLILGVLIFGFFFAGCDLGTDSNTSSGNSGKPPSAPYLQGTYTATETMLSWTSVQGADGYYVYTSTNAEPNNLHRIADTSETSYIHYTTLSYNYVVRAYNSHGNGPFSNFVNTY
jgi:hypothetical protein